mmetsp:Transcript_7353/g.10694  ORF Transcript_7353/g.10694 Transcript_7353/m.10694 type:complete len:816 (-) Transcript_7353:102-2549(-)|eukprot:CAMPEP_0172422706 /NCGR_PEP_ID=MMETSP1064-20121228/8840_1 /TAXON_ID=202472 /ORGANISM="Aulacoseira subarctica , Strain CCAP 1002/5" /LENGTH=815 /DNA_ID=CAMNT_0013163703 /DNA_START=24 /DNA_END=2471 /DNA_ORIENTATION=+
MRSQREKYYASRNLESEPFRRRDNYELENSNSPAYRLSSGYDMKSPLAIDHRINGRGAAPNSARFSYENSGMLRSPADRTPATPPRVPPRKAGSSAPVAPGALLIVDQDDDACSEMTESVWISPRGNAGHHRYKPSVDMLAMEEDSSFNEAELTPKSYMCRDYFLRDNNRFTTAEMREENHQFPRSGRNLPVNNQPEQPLVSSYYARRRLQQHGRPDDSREETPTRVSTDADKGCRVDESMHGVKNFRSETPPKMREAEFRSEKHLVSLRNAPDSEGERTNILGRDHSNRADRNDIRFSESQESQMKESLSARKFTPNGSDISSRGGMERTGTTYARQEEQDRERRSDESRASFIHDSENRTHSTHENISAKETNRYEKNENNKSPRSQYTRSSSSPSKYNQFGEKETNRCEETKSSKSPRSYFTRNSSSHTSPSTTGITSKDFFSSKESISSRANESNHPYPRSAFQEEIQSHTLQEVTRDKLQNLEREVEEMTLKNSIIEKSKKNESFNAPDVAGYQAMLQDMHNEQDRLKLQLSDLHHRLLEYETIDRDMKALKLERNKLEEHYKNILDNLEQKLTNARNELESEKNFQNEKVKALEETYSARHDKDQSDKARFLDIIKDLEDQLSAKDRALSELSSKEKELHELSRSNHELKNRIANVERELLNADKQCNEANALVQEIEDSLRNHRSASASYENEMAMMVNEIKLLKNDNEQLTSNTFFYKSKIDECQNTLEDLRREVEYEKQEKDAMVNSLKEEANAYKRENQEISQSYERRLQEAEYNNRVLEDAATEDSMVIEGLRKQLKKYQMMRH